MKKLTGGDPADSAVDGADVTEPAAPPVEAASAPPAEEILPMPQQGGSFVRSADGSLEREEA